MELGDQEPDQGSGQRPVGLCGGQLSRTLVSQQDSEKPCVEQKQPEVLANEELKRPTEETPVGRHKSSLMWPQSSGLRGQRRSSLRGLRRSNPCNKDHGRFGHEDSRAFYHHQPAWQHHGWSWSGMGPLERFLSFFNRLSKAIWELNQWADTFKSPHYSCLCWGKTSSWGGFKSNLIFSEWNNLLYWITGAGAHPQESSFLVL